MEGYIDLKRHFFDYSENSDPESAAQQSYIDASFGRDTNIYWDNLLESKYVIVLGEAGSGKSWEFSAQQELLKANGKFSFFLRLENLVDGSLSDALDSADESFFREWLYSEEHATFFLDSVDEAKLKKHNALSDALNHFAKDIGLDVILRANIVISSRISEWRSSVDKAEVCRRFGISSNDKESASPLKIVLLAPLNEQQLRQLAEAKDAHNVDEFIQAINQQSALEFASRPLDAELLIEYWKTNRCIGTRQELLEYSIPKKLSERIERKLHDPLTSDKARVGAEILAAAGILCKQFNILVPDTDISDITNALDIQVLLPDWSAQERAALLGRSIFDGATYGRIRFHHRTTTEYLCACWLQQCMFNQLPYPDLEDILFMRIHGNWIVRPTMAAVSTWLATLGDNIWNRRVRKFLLEYSPETFLQFGEPRSLRTEDLKLLLRHLIARYEDREFTRLSTESYQLTALAQPDLADELSSIIQDKTISDEIRIEIILAIWHGKLMLCSDALLNIIDSDDSNSIKQYAVITLNDVANNDQLVRLNVITQKHTKLPSVLCAYLCEALYPKVISPVDLFSLIEKVSPLKDKLSMDIPYYLERLFKKGDIPQIHYNELLQGFIRLCQSPPYIQKGNKTPKVSTDFAWLGEAFLQLLIKILSQNVIDNNLYPQITISLSLLGDINEVSSSHRFDKGKLQLNQVLLHHPDIRRNYIWTQIDRNYKSDTKFNAHIILGYYKMVSADQSDIEWLITDIRKPQTELRKKQALWLAVALSSYVLLPKNSKKRLQKALSGNRELIRTLHKGMPRKYMAVYYRLKYKFLSPHFWWEIKWSSKQKITKMYYYVLNRIHLYRNLNDIRSGKNFDNLHYLAQVSAEKEDDSPSRIHNWKNLIQPYGLRIATAARDGWIAFWRTYEAPLNNRTDGVEVGLAGIKTELTEGLLLLSSVSDPDAELMTRYAIHSYNGYPDWLTMLARTNPKSVQNILNQCIHNEWKHPADDQLFYGTITHLMYVPLIIQDLVVEELQKKLKISDPTHPEVLSNALTILLLNQRSDKTLLIDLSVERLSELSTEKRAFINWLSILLQIDCTQGIAFLEQKLNRTEVDADKLMLNIASSLDSRHGSSRSIIHNPSYKHAACLRALIPLANRHIKSADDINRLGGGTYSPDKRDYAQSFRDELLPWLANADDTTAYQFLEELLDEPELKDKRDFILHLMDKRAMHDADLAAWLPEQVYEFKKENEAHPRSNHDLFKLVVRRLQSIKDYVERDDYSPRNIFDITTHESELRKWLANQLRERANNKYSEVQEVEVDLKKEPDIRVLSPGIHPVSIEIKWADNWTVEELEEALTTQLVGQYLRTPDSNYGVLILGYRGKKKTWEYKNGSVNINLTELVEHIRTLASAVEDESENVLGLSVYSIDFTTPNISSNK